MAARRILLAMVAVVGAVAHAASLPYEKELWPRTRLLVWAQPGVDGSFHLASNWLEDGKPAARGPDARTDVLLPAAETSYLVRPDPDGPGADVACRHITVESNAGFAAGYRNGQNLTVHGNAHVKAGGRLNSVVISGERHTFVRYDAHDFATGDMRCSDPNPRTWAPNALSWKFDINKAPDASVTFHGRIGIVDELLVHSGLVILASESEVRFGKTTTGAMEIFSGATVELSAGAVLAPFINQLPREAQGNIRILGGGTLTAGSQARPLTGDAYVLVGFAEGNPLTRRVLDQDILDGEGILTLLESGSDLRAHALALAMTDLRSTSFRNVRLRAASSPAARAEFLRTLAASLERALGKVDLADPTLWPERSDDLATALAALAARAGDTTPGINERSRFLVSAAWPHLVSAPRNADGIYAAAGSRLAVASADPARARLVISSITSERGQASGVTQGHAASVGATAERGIELNLGGTLDLDGVVFDYVRAGSIGLADPESWRGWQHVEIGPHAASPELGALVTTFRGAREWHGWVDRHQTARGSIDTMLYRPVIDPPGGLLLAGESQSVALSARARGAEIRYTLDGSPPTASSPLYTAPLVLDRTTVVSAACFRDGRALGESPAAMIATARFETGEPIAARVTHAPAKGVIYELIEGKTGVAYAHGETTTLDFETFDPPLARREDRVRYRGLIHVTTTAAYTFLVNSQGARMLIDGVLVLDSVPPATRDQGDILLAAGHHTLVIEVDPSRGAARNPARFGDQVFTIAVRSRTAGETLLEGDWLWHETGAEAGPR